MTDQVSLEKSSAATPAAGGRATWALAGIVVGLAGLATSYLTVRLFDLEPQPVVAVLDRVRDLAPGDVANWARENLGKASKPITTVATLAILFAVFGAIGRLGRRHSGFAVLGFAALAVIGGASVLGENGTKTTDLLPVVVGFVTWGLAFGAVATRLERFDEIAATDPLDPAYDTSRRGFLMAVGVVAGLAGLSGVIGRFAVGGRVPRLNQERRLLRLSATTPVVPEGARFDVVGAQPWMTRVDDFYLIDTSFSRPVILAEEWSLRIHGMVEKELTITYADLLERELTEQWVTLNCVSNEVGGDLIGNAWWSGVLLAPLLAEAGVSPEADAVLQTSSDGWNCGTPLAALTDPERGAMLAVAMNGEPLTREHGYPVRTLVPGLYGYVSATKWVVDFEVTRFSDFSAYWTDRGWSELGPVKMASRIEVPANGADLPAGTVVVAGHAWHQHTGIRGVEIAVDGGAWQPAELAESPTIDSWVQWKALLELPAGEHAVKVRAIDLAGEVQTGAVAGVLPDGSTGWHQIGFRVG